MEIRDHHIDDREIVWRPDEKIGLTAKRRAAGGFQSAHRGRTDGHDAPAALTAGGNRRRRRFRQLAPFRMHDVLSRIIGLQRLKRAEPDV